LAIRDVDLIDTHTATAVFKSSASSAHLPGFSEGTSHIGTFIIAPVVVESNSDTDNGATLGWHFTLSDSDPVLQSLAQGQTITQIYTVTFTDNHGAQVSQDVTVTITGTNDAPTIISNAAAAKGAVTEDSSLTLLVGGTLAIRDVDLIDTHTAAAVFKSSASSAHLPGFSDGTSLGSFTIDPSVAESAIDVDKNATLGWHFSLDNSNATLQSLAQGQSITEVYTVTFTDNHGAQVSQDVTVTINGANDAPTVTSSADAAKGAVTEDAGAWLTIDGTLTIQDLDLIDTHTATAVLKLSTSSAHLPGFIDGTSLGNFTIDPSVTELATDTDTHATLGWHFSLANGNATLQSLAQGQSIIEVYTVTFTDNHGAQVSQDVTVTINGANDAPTVTSDADAAKGAVTEDGGPTLSADGTLAIRDLDLIDTHTAQAVFKVSSVSAVLPGFDGSSHLGTFTIDSAVTESNGDTANGATLGWHFTLDGSDPVLQSLAEGQTITQVYTVTFTDNHNASVTQDVTVTITGTNDAPILSAVTAGTLTDSAATDSFADLTGKLAGIDVDAGETTTLVYAAVGADDHGTVAGLYGSLTVNSDGSYSYVPDATAINALPEGSYSDVFTVQVADVHGAVTTATYTVDISGANDVPTLADINAGALTDTAATDTFPDLTGHLSGHDADGGETASLTYAVLSADHTAATTVAGLYGSLTVNPDGSYSYVPNAAVVNALPEGSYQDAFTVRTTDVHGASATATLTVDVTGADDAAGPVIDTTSFYVWHNNEGNTDTITGLSVVDPGASTDDFEITAVTAHRPDSSVDPVTMSGDLDQINVTLADGVTYVPGDEPPATDMITLTVTDKTTGLFDTVNFIFNEAGDTSQGITLQGTGGKDVIFATEASDTLIGGAGKDQFVFAPAASQDSVQHIVNDFETGLDKIDLRQFSGIGSISDIGIAQQSDGALITLDGHETILLKSVIGANLHASDFIFGGGHVT
ncbi:VCBS domain-containing protein, partial [Bradyrhizobium sp. SRS-191]|uniref:VCBS domain-containing protein n=1 Tax=Bradyrhizobium sp. SRS-191 TaxID=2962606 RepID=UPI00211DD786